MKIPNFQFPIAGLMRRAFTLIEMLVVIAIIAILASILVGTLGRSSEAKVRSRVEAERDQLVGAIESFHKKHGFYPPGNELKINGAINTGTNQLFYELTGTDYNKDNQSFTNILGNTLSSGAIDALFRAKGFVNSDVNKQNFLPNLKPSGHATIPDSVPPVRVLVVPYDGPGGRFNPWHYNSSKPVRNPDSYDLWAVIQVAGKQFTVGNWKE